MKRLVSVVIATFNEINHIDDCISSVLDQTYTNVEVLVVDGMSTDGTRDRLAQLAEKHANVHFLDNPQRRAPFAFNIGIENSRGDIVCILGAHAEYPRDYLESCVRLHCENPTVANVGGQTQVHPSDDGIQARTIAVAVSHPFGLGGVAYRQRQEPGFIKSVFPGCYKRSVFVQVGLFDERLLRGQDQELNLRITNRGGRILYDPSIKVGYYSRRSFSLLANQYFRTGLSIVYTARVLGQAPSYRQFVPICFVIGIVASLLLALLGLLPSVPALAASLPLICIAAAYGLLAIGFTISSSVRERAILWPLPFAFLLLHAAYGIGTICGLATVRRWWDRNSRYQVRFLPKTSSEEAELVHFADSST